MPAFDIASLPLTGDDRGLIPAIAQAATAKC
jgi:hypothetical protein